MRALSCANPSITTRDNLINLLLETRQRDIEENNNTKNMVTSMKLDTVSEDYFLKFFFCFLRVQNIYYSRIGIDELET